MKRNYKNLFSIFTLLTSSLAFGQHLTEGFENGGAAPAGWTLTNGTDDWQFDDGTSDGPGTVQGGSYAAYFDDYNFTTGTTADLITPSIDLTSAFNPELRFWYHDGDGSDNVEILISTDGTTYTSIYTTPTSVTSWTEIVVPITAMAGQSTVTIAFRGTSVYGFSNPYIDDVSVVDGPTCPQPTGVTASNITSTGADISWTTGGATNWNIEYGPAGFSPGAGTMVMNVTNPFSLSMLTATTDYDVYVQDSCGNGDVSSWVMTSFTTPCGAYTPIYSEDFTSFVPTCWEEAGNGTPSTGPSSIGSGNWTSDGFLNNGTTGAARIEMWLSGDNEWLITPDFDLSGTTQWELSFDAGVTAWSGTGAATLDSDDEIILLISEDNGTTWDTLDIFNAANSPSNMGESKLYDLTSYTANAKFAFWANEGSTYGGVDLNFYIDNFDIHELPPCVAPTSLAISGVTGNSAEAAWTAGGSTDWNVEYGPAGFTPGTGTMMTGVTNPYTISGLMANTEYDFYVQDSCGVGNSSAWVSSSFTTMLDDCASLMPVTLPFVEDFESQNANVSVNSNIYCGADKSWDFYTDNQTFGQVTFGSASPENNGGNGAALLDVNTNSNNAINDLVLTLDMSSYTAAANDIYLSFDFADWGDETDAHDRVWVRGSNTDAWLEIFDWSGINSQTWNSISQTLSISSLLTTNSQDYSTSFQVKFGQDDDFSYSSDGLFLDNIVIEEITCFMPTFLNTPYQNADSIVLNWTAGASETMWNVEYGPVGFMPGTGTMVSSTATTDTISGLALGSIFDFYVQADCGGGDSSRWVGPLTAGTQVLNDSTCEAIFIAPNTDYSSQLFSNMGATLQTDESALSGSQYNTVWFKTVVPASGHLLIATCESDFNSVVGVYAHDTIICDSMETYGQVAYNSSNFGICGVSSRGSVEICGETPGDTLLFYVGGSTSTQSGIISLVVTDYTLEGAAGQPLATPNQFCAGDTINLFEQISGQLTNQGYWSYPSNSAVIIDDTTANTGALTLTGTDIYYIVNNTCSYDTATVALNVSTVANTGTAISNFQACSNGDVFLFDALTGTVDAGGSWNDDTNTGLLNINKFIADGLPDGPYQFTYSVDNGVCPASSTQVTVNLVDCTNITEGESTTFGIYPNPNDGTFFITNGKNESNIVMEVIDVQGKVIYNNTYVMAAGSQQEVSLGNVESGVYLVRVVTNNQVFNSNVIVK